MCTKRKKGKLKEVGFDINTISYFTLWNRMKWNRKNNCLIIITLKQIIYSVMCQEMKKIFLEEIVKFIAFDIKVKPTKKR